jgi:hypothetical protein
MASLSSAGGGGRSAGSPAVAQLAFPLNKKAAGRRTVVPSPLASSSASSLSSSGTSSAAASAPPSRPAWASGGSRTDRDRDSKEDAVDAAGLAPRPSKRARLGPSADAGEGDEEAEEGDGDEAAGQNIPLAAFALPRGVALDEDEDDNEEDDFVPTDAQALVNAARKGR